MIPPQELQQKQFTRAMRGYDSAEVDEYVNFIIGKYTEIYRQCEIYDKKLRIVSQKIGEIQERESEIQGREEIINKAVISSQRHHDTIISDAEDAAVSIIDEAEKAAEQILADARKRAQTALAAVDRKLNMQIESAQEKSDALLLSARTRCTGLLSDLKKEISQQRENIINLKNTADSFSENLTAMYKHQLAFITDSFYVPNIDFEKFTETKLFDTVMKELRNDAIEIARKSGDIEYDFERELEMLRDTEFINEYDYKSNKDGEIKEYTKKEYQIGRNNRSSINDRGDRYDRADSDRTDRNNRNNRNENKYNDSAARRDYKEDREYRDNRVAIRENERNNSAGSENDINYDNHDYVNDVDNAVDTDNSDNDVKVFAGKTSYGENKEYNSDSTEKSVSGGNTVTFNKPEQKNSKIPDMPVEANTSTSTSASASGLKGYEPEYEVESAPEKNEIGIGIDSKAVETEIESEIGVEEKPVATYDSDDYDDRQYASINSHTDENENDGSSENYESETDENENKYANFGEYNDDSEPDKEIEKETKGFFGFFKRKKKKTGKFKNNKSGDNVENYYIDEDDNGDNSDDSDNSDNNNNDDDEYYGVGVDETGDDDGDEEVMNIFSGLDDDDDK